MCGGPISSTAAAIYLKYHETDTDTDPDPNTKDSKRSNNHVHQLNGVLYIVLIILLGIIYEVGEGDGFVLVIKVPGVEYGFHIIIIKQKIRHLHKGCRIMNILCLKYGQHIQ